MWVAPYVRGSSNEAATVTYSAPSVTTLIHPTPTILTLTPPPTSILLSQKKRRPAIV